MDLECSQKFNYYLSSLYDKNYDNAVVAVKQISVRLCTTICQHSDNNILRNTTHKKLSYCQQMACKHKVKCCTIVQKSDFKRFVIGETPLKVSQEY